MSAEGSGPVIVTIDDQDDEVVDQLAWGALAKQVLIDEGIGPNAELNVTFIGDCLLYTSPSPRDRG